jgi:hypothetical protein
MRWLWLGVALAACGTASEDVATSNATVLATDDTDAAVPPAPLGSIADEPLALDGRSHPVAYSPDAPFTAFPIEAEAGHVITFLVDSRTPGAKPAIWLTDDRFVTLASSSTGAATVFVSYSVETTGTLYLVLREASAKKASFLITPRDHAPPPPPAAEDAGAAPPDVDAGR